MKKLLLALAFVLCGLSSAEAQLTVPDSCLTAENNGDAVVECTLTGVLSTDVIVVACGNYQNQTCVITDDHPNTYSTHITANSVGNSRATMAWALTPTAGDTVIRGTLSGNNYKCVAAMVLRGASQGAIQDSDTATGADSATVTGPTVTPSGTAAMVSFFSTMSNTPIGVTGGGTELEENQNTSYSLCGLQWESITSDDAPTWSKGAAGSSLGAYEVTTVVIGQAAAVGSAIAFPGCEGFGCVTRHAYAGSATPQICRVTNLNNSGAGSLRIALEGTGGATGETDCGHNPRIVIFETSGLLNCTGSYIVISDPYVYVAGETAPKPGFAVKGCGIYFTGYQSANAHDGVLRHLTVIPGASPPAADGGIGIQYPNGGAAANIVIDHCSIFWSHDESTMAFGNPTFGNVTYSNCFISEGLNTGAGTSGSGGLIAAGTTGASPVTNVSYIRNLFAHMPRRGGVWQFQQTEAAFINNLYYNAANTDASRAHWFTCDTTQNGPSAGSVYAIFKGQSYIKGPTDPDGPVVIQWDDNGNCNFTGGTYKVYQDDTLTDPNGGSAWTNFYNPAGRPTPITGTPPVELDGILSNVTVIAATGVEAYVLAHSGAFPLNRNTHDARMVTEVGAYTGSIKTTSTYGEGSVGTYPTWTVNTINHSAGAHPRPSNPHAVSTDGYTELELWIASYGCEVEVNSNCWASPPNPPTPTYSFRGANRGRR